MGNCLVCRDMSRFDEAIAKSLGLGFADINLKVFEVYDYYRRILPPEGVGQGEVSFPTYLLVHDVDGDFCIQGEIVGPMSSETFQGAICALVDARAGLHRFSTSSD